MELPNHLARFGAMNKSLESEVGIEPTFAVLQTDAYSSIDNSPLARSAGVAPTSWDLESQAHRYEYQDRIEKLVGHKGIEPLSCGP